MVELAETVRTLLEVREDAGDSRCVEFVVEQSLERLRPADSMEPSHGGETRGPGPSFPRGARYRPADC